METQASSAEDAAGEPARVSPRLLWLIGLLMAALLAGGGWLVTQNILTSRAIEQLGRSAAARPAAPVPTIPTAAAPLRPPPAPVTPPAALVTSSGTPAPSSMANAALPAAPTAAAGSWSGDDADLAAETSGRSRGESERRPGSGALRSSGGSEQLEALAAREPPAADLSGASLAGRSGSSAMERPPVRKARKRDAAPAVSDELLFVRCPRPGVPGAVECRRAVCAGAAGRSEACRFFGGNPD